MTKIVFMCRKYYDLMRCNGYIQGKCTACYKADSMGAEFCDICGIEIDDWEEKYEDYHNSETGQDICRSCRKEFYHES